MNDAKPNAAAVLLFQPVLDRVLVVREHDTIQQRDCYGIPGGKLEPGESPYEAAKRELLEETGFELQQAEALLIQPAGPHVCACFLAKAFRMPESRPSNVDWVEPEALVEPGARFPAFYAKMFVALAIHQRVVSRLREGVRRLQPPSPLTGKRIFFPQF